MMGYPSTSSAFYPSCSLLYCLLFQELYLDPKIMTSFQQLLKVATCWSCMKRDRMMRRLTMRLRFQDRRQFRSTLYMQKLSTKCTPSVPTLAYTLPQESNGLTWMETGRMINTRIQGHAELPKRTHLLLGLSVTAGRASTSTLGAVAARAGRRAGP
ncbi:hypothetical protein NEOLEDRAFT_657439 [Neolentinus lepideus HHB14362 ss-1]|uniref:Uncharacterized protein n=1 Tax=Neolentinus lepideus HHB14362 ss-1 TaxID=1314782 RepID=A0A165QFR6_9AGAM|nr:hypothetical protein NEOLEDRAFT_657439 [Neolentinus lepideus HHB14362 ss-1]